jgi:hypothetical protein
VQRRLCDWVAVFSLSPLSAWGGLGKPGPLFCVAPQLSSGQPEAKHRPAVTKGQALEEHRLHTDPDIANLLSTISVEAFALSLACGVPFFKSQTTMGFRFLVSRRSFPWETWASRSQSNPDRTQEGAGPRESGARRKRRKKEAAQEGSD